MAAHGCGGGHGAGGRLRGRAREDVFSAALIRLLLLTAVALYAWGAIYVLERAWLRVHPSMKIKEVKC